MSGSFAVIRDVTTYKELLNCGRLGAFSLSHLFGGRNQLRVGRTEGRVRKGFLEVGRGGGSSKGERGRGGEARLLGDAARLRKGLLDERLSVKPIGGPFVAR